MKLKDLRERVKGGKLDPLSKMGKSKLTGQEIASYYRKNPKAKQAARDPMVKKAIELALDLGGNQTLAVKEIEKMKKGLSKNSAVANALRTANEDMTSTSSVAMPEIPLGRKHKVMKRKELEEAVLGHDFGNSPFSKKEAEEAKKLAKQYSVKVIKPKNPKSKNHLQFQGGVRNLQAFYRNLQMIMNESRDKSVKLSRPEKGMRTITIDFSKASNPKKAKEKTIAIAKRYMIKVGKPKKPQSKDDVAFTGSKKAMNLFGREFNLAGRTGLLENKEKLSPAKAQYKKFNIMRTQLYRFVKAKTKAHKFAIDDLMLMTSPKVIEGMYKRNPQGFTRMMDKMYPNEKAKMTKGDFTVLGDFIDARGKVIKGKGDVSENTSLNEETILYRVKDIQKPELDKFKSSARLMKLKINIKQSPRGKETIIRLEGGKKQIRDFDAVARGKSSYGDPSIVEDAVERAKELADLKAKHKKEVEQEKDEIERTKQSAQTESFNLNEESETMKKVRYVIKRKSMMKIDGMKLDLTTASMIASVYDKVNPQNKKRMDSLKLPQLVNLTMKVAGKTRKESTELQEMHPKSMDAMKRLNQKTPDAFKDQMPTIGWDAGKQMYRVVMLSKKTGKPVRTSHIPVSREFPAPKDKNKINAKELGKAMKTLEKKIGMKIGIDESVHTESLWANIHNKRKRGEKMRKPGEKGAPTAQDFKNARGEAVSPAQQAAIAISKKERGEKPKNECADEKDFKPHKMYKGDKEVMANTYDDHVKYDKMGYTHEKPKKEALDAKDKPFVKDLVKKLRGGSKTHAKQADDLEKAMNTESMSRARRDAMRDMGTRKDKDDDGYGTATDDDRKAADKNVIMQIRKVADLPKGGQIELPSGKKVKMDRKSAIALNKKFDSIRKPQDKLKLQKMMNDKKISVVALKRLLGK